MVELPIYERFPALSEFLPEFQEKVFEPQGVLALDVALNDTLAQWWAMHKHNPLLGTMSKIDDGAL